MEDKLLKLGPHTKKLETPRQQREHARQQGWGAFQTHYGNPRSLQLTPPSETLDVGEPTPDDPIWVIHAAYPAHVAQETNHLGRATADYLRTMLRTAKHVGAHYVVVHVGGTKDKTEEEVANKIETFLRYYQFEQFLTENLNTPGELPIYLLLENVAANYPFNRELENLINVTQKFTYVGWCLDTAHSNAAGIAMADLLNLIKKLPPELLPKVCHANYPGSGFASGRDRHAWRYQLQHDSESLIPEDTTDWDNVVRILAERNTRLILEGGSTEGDLDQEVAFVRKLVTTNG